MIPFIHVYYLMDRLRFSAVEAQKEAMADERGGLDSCLRAALMNDAADALELMVRHSVANDDPHGA